jgi:hypothetical protein
MARSRALSRALLLLLGALVSPALPLGCGGSDRRSSDDAESAARLGCTQTDANHTAVCLCATTSDLRGIVDTTYLERLVVAPEAKIDFAPLERLANLEALAIDSDRPVDLHQLSSLERIRDLTIETRGVDWRPIGALTFLTKLTLIELGDRGPKANAADLSFLDGLRELRDLDISRVKVVDFSWLSRLSKLEKLEIHCPSCDDAEGLARFRKDNPVLDTLALRGTVIDFGSGGEQERCAIRPGGCAKGPICGRRSSNDDRH